MWISIIISSILVSLDAMLVGIALGLKSRYNFTHSIILNLSVLFMCIIAYIIAVLSNNFININTSVISGIGFLLIGLKSFYDAFKKDESEVKCCSIAELLILGVVVGIDASIATFSLTFTFENFIIPLLITFCHFAMLSIGWAVVGLKKKPNGKLLKIFSGVCLIILGILKFTNIF